MTTDTTERKLVGFANFKRHNPLSDKFTTYRFHHIELWTSDSINVVRRFNYGLGMPTVAKSDLTTGNRKYFSYAVKSNELIFVITSPNSTEIPDTHLSIEPHPAYNVDIINKFVNDHGLAVRAVAVKCENAKEAYEIAVANGAVGVLEPKELHCRFTNKTSVISEIRLFGDSVIRFMSGDFDGAALPGYEPLDVKFNEAELLGIERADHIVSNVPHLFPAIDYIMNALGFHEFSEFTAEDVGTVDSGLNSMVLANNNEYVLFPINEPTHGTPRKSQIQTYLEHNKGPGVQHIAIKSKDIFKTMRGLRMRSNIHNKKYLTEVLGLPADFDITGLPDNGFDFMPAPGKDYYQRIPSRVGEDAFSADQLKELEELGLLVDKDDQGILIQIFTQPIGDRSTIFFEFIQRLGCDIDSQGKKKEQTAGCGGFGKGNFTQLFKSIEDFEKLQDAITK